MAEVNIVKPRALQTGTNACFWSPRNKFLEHASSRQRPSWLSFRTELNFLFYFASSPKACRQDLRTISSL